MEEKMVYVTKCEYNIDIGRLETESVSANQLNRASTV